MVLKHVYSAKDHSFITYSFVKKSVVNNIELTAVSDLPLFFDTVDKIGYNQASRSKPKICGYP